MYLLVPLSGLPFGGEFRVQNQSAAVVLNSVGVALQSLKVTVSTLTWLLPTIQEPGSGVQHGDVSVVFCIELLAS